MKRYVITQGEYSDYRIVTFLEGADNSDLDALYKLFLGKFDVPRKDDYRKDDYTWSMQYWELYRKAIEGLKVEFATDDNYLFQFFIAWLKRDCGFKEAADIEEFRVPEE